MTTDIPDWIADAHRDDGKRFVVRADEKLTAFIELESVINACGELAWRAGAIFDKLGVPFKGSESRGSANNENFQEIRIETSAPI